jgi:PAS domain-containing protein
MTHRELLRNPEARLQQEAEATTTVSAFARYRQTVLTRAGQILDPAHATPLADRPDVLPAVTGLLMTSLEELKVAEEEMREQNDMLIANRSEQDVRLRHYRDLFLHSPVPSFITDARATILEVNLAAAALFRREARHLEHKPLAALLPQDVRGEFRMQVDRVTPEARLTDWRLTLNRTGDTPVNVRAAVSAMPRGTESRSTVLYWALYVESSTAKA